MCKSCKKKKATSNYHGPSGSVSANYYVNALPTKELKELAIARLAWCETCRYNIGDFCQGRFINKLVCKQDATCPLGVWYEYSLK